MAGSLGRYRQALRNRDFRLVLTAFVIDESGTWAYSVVLAAYLFARTGSPTWVAVAYAIRLIVDLICSVPAGVVADRYDRRRVVQTGALAAALIAGVLALLVARDAPIWTLLVASSLLKVVTSVNRPAAGALTPNLVSESDLAAANSVLALAENVVVVLGPALGGLLLLTGRPETAMAVNAASFLVSVVLFGLVSTGSRGNAAPGVGILAQFADGVRILAAHRVAFVLVALLVVDTAVFGAATAFFAPLSVYVGTGADGYSYLVTACAIGGVVGAVFAERLAARTRLAPVVVGGFLVECVPIAFLTMTHVPVVAALLVAAFGGGMVIIDVVGLTAVQRDLPREALGRANAIMLGSASGAAALASLAASGLYAATNLTVTVVVVGVGFLGLALLGLPAVMRNDRASAAAVAAREPRIDLLRSLDLFAGASRSVLERLADAASERSVPAGTTVIRQGEPADALYLLTEGRLAVQVAENGARSPRPDVTAPGYVGEIGLLKGIPRTATVVAATGCTLLRVSAVDFAGALETASASQSLLTLSGERFARNGRVAVNS